ncbi:hypothetical protein Hanom_Chr12g01161931 [Helianthus anomalus]
MSNDICLLSGNECLRKRDFMCILHLYCNVFTDKYPLQTSMRRVPLKHTVQTYDYFS